MLSLVKFFDWKNYYGVKPVLSHLRLFGCFCYVRTYDQLRKKWDPTSVKARFTGYGSESNSDLTWKVRKCGTEEDVVSRNVIFDETSTFQEGTMDPVLSELFRSQQDSLLPGSIIPDVPLSVTTRSVLEESANANPVSLRTRSAHRSIDAEQLALEAKISVDGEHLVPNTIKDAMGTSEAEQWCGAIERENESLMKNDVFTVMERPKVCYALGLKWVFALKKDAQGNIIRYKARCTALGNFQREGLDYGEVFSPVVRYSTIRMLLATAAKRDLILESMDVDTAFLYGVLPTDEPAVYVDVPFGFPVPNHLIGKENLVCKVHKAIYGLRQSPRL